jgi:hypothetical protein
MIAKFFSPQRPQRTQSFSLCALWPLWCGFVCGSTGARRHGQSRATFLRKKNPQRGSPERLRKAVLSASTFFAVSPLVAQLPEQPQFQQAYDFFVRQRFEPAIDAFNAYLALPDLDRQSQIVANQFLAFSYYALRRGEANQTVRHILELDIHAKVDSGLFQPTYVDFFNYAKAQAVGRVSIRSTPPGAKVFLQKGATFDFSAGRSVMEKKNNFIGTTPLDTLLLTGSYTLVLERSGYRLAQENPEIKGGPNNLSYNLAPKSKNLKWYAAIVGASLAGAFFILMILATPNGV